MMSDEGIPAAEVPPSVTAPDGSLESFVALLTQVVQGLHQQQTQFSQSLQSLAEKVRQPAVQTTVEFTAQSGAGGLSVPAQVSTAGGLPVPAQVSTAGGLPVPAQVSTGKLLLFMCLL